MSCVQKFTVKMRKCLFFFQCIILAFIVHSICFCCCFYAAFFGFFFSCRCNLLQFDRNSSCYVFVLHSRLTVWMVALYVASVHRTLQCQLSLLLIIKCMRKISLLVVQKKKKTHKITAKIFFFFHTVRSASQKRFFRKHTTS